MPAGREASFMRDLAAAANASKALMTSGMNAAKFACFARSA